MPARNDNIIITCTERENELHFFDIHYYDKPLSINCYLTFNAGKLLLTQIDIEGPGTNSLGSGMRKIIRDIAYEFCLLYECHAIELRAAKRTKGRTKGAVLKPIKFVFDDLKELYDQPQK